MPRRDPGVIDRIADGTVLRGKVQGKRKRLLTAGFVLRAVVLMTLMPGADLRGGDPGAGRGPGLGAVGAGLAAWRRRGRSASGGRRSARGRWKTCRTVVLGASRERA